MILDRYTIEFGKYKGIKLGDIPKKDLEDYLLWMEDHTTGYCAVKLISLLQTYLGK